MTAAPQRSHFALALMLAALATLGPFSIDTFLPAMPTIARALGVDDSRFDARVERGDPCRDGGVIVRMEVI